MSNGLKDESLFSTHLFLYYVSKGAEPSAVSSLMQAVAEPTEDYEFDHDEIIDKIVQVGVGLGFESRGEVHIAKGAIVDAVWEARIANLGVITYVFEV